MITIILFLALFIGINIRENIIVSLIGLVLLLTFTFFKRGKKITFLSIVISLMGVGLSFIRPTFIKERYQGVVIEVKDNYYIFSSTFEKIYVYEPNHDREIGDVLLINGDKEPLDFKVLESEFDFKEYLNHKGVYSQLLVKDIEVKFSNPIHLHQFKKSFLNNFDENSKENLRRYNIFVSNMDLWIADAQRKENFKNIFDLKSNMVGELKKHLFEELEKEIKVLSCDEADFAKRKNFIETKFNGIMNSLPDYFNTNHFYNLLNKMSPNIIIEHLELCNSNSVAKIFEELFFYCGVAH